MAVREVYKNIYQVQVPLPNNPLKELNCYVIADAGDVYSEQRHLMIDTGFNNQKSFDAVLDAFLDLGIVKQDTDIFLTHLHADHAGMAPRLKTDENVVYASTYDADVMGQAQSDEYWENLASESILMGFPKDQILTAADHPGYSQKANESIQYRILEPGNKIQAVDYIFEVVDLAGHTPGQIGLYEPNHKLLFCGDHILNKITPNITYWSDDFDALGVYMQNLRKVRDMDIKLLFTAHRQPVEDVKERIDQLLKHHEKRLTLCLDMLKQKPSTVYEVSHGLNWDFGGGDFKNFPLTQKWFAAGEAYAHLEHLYHTGKAKKELIDGQYVYQI